MSQGKRYTFQRQGLENTIISVIKGQGKSGNFFSKKWKLEKVDMFLQHNAKELHFKPTNSPRTLPIMLEFCVKSEYES